MRKIKVLSIYKRFKGNFLNQNEKNVQREIFLPSFTRLGMELNGIFLNEKILCIVCWGKQESTFLNKFKEEKQIEMLTKILEKNPAMFLLSKNFQHTDLLVKLNKEINDDNSAIIQVDYSTVEIYSLIGPWISKALLKWETIHGTVLNIWGQGVLIIGEPGVGKSEAASELIRMNHLFLGDDAIDITRLGTVILARPNPFSEGFIHIRGLGILNIKEMYGGMKMIKETSISVVIELRHANSSFQSNDAFENIGESTKFYNLLNVQLPLYTLPVTYGRNVSELIELAVIDMKLKKQGYNSAQAMTDNYKKIIDQKE